MQLRARVVVEAIKLLKKGARRRRHVWLKCAAIKLVSEPCGLYRAPPTRVNKIQCAWLLCQRMSDSCAFICLTHVPSPAMRSATYSASRAIPRR